MLIVARWFKPQIERIRLQWPDVDFIAAPDETETKTCSPAEWSGVEVAVVGGSTDLEPLLPYLPRLRWVHAASVGVDRVAPVVRRQPQIVLTNARGSNATPIAEHVLMSILAQARSLPEVLDDQRRQLWRQHSAREVTGATLVLAGYGTIGRETARRARGLGMNVIAVRRHAAGNVEEDGVRIVGPDAVESILPAADYLALMLPHTPETYHWLDERKLALLPPRCVVINVGRGSLVDEEALLAALRAGRLSGACLDVFEKEPLPEGHPFWATPGVMVTPHMAYASPRTVERGASIFSENLRRFLSGEPLLNRVDTERGY